MKKIIVILTLVFFSTLAFGQTDSIRGNQYNLNGKIINQISLPPHCGYFAFGTIVEFKIIDYSNPNYKQDSIGVIFTCPEFYGDGFFEVGKTYTLTVADENQADFGWTIPNDFLLSKYTLDKNLWVIKADKIE
ncbi:hypothetical protein [Mangrovimonas sp. YM274]|uniref:hypothetical protein n=1 Tax=Mangrovimonas sp. YM274 TaxID=3070660 RepID=UPI0027DDA7E1|nr:hypothetical protein [Mangrovimonas sp. YM274]WMI68196.1 hypothetical protein RBH95_13705 [Mangrovimonas sp. YM274]